MQSRLPYGVRSTGRRTFTGCSAYDNIGPHSGPGSHKIERTPPQCGTLLQTKPWKSSLLPTGLCTFTPYSFKQIKSMVILYKKTGRYSGNMGSSRRDSCPALSRRKAPGGRTPSSQPHRAESMGMTCFFRDMILGRNTTSSTSSTLKAWRMVSRSPTNSS